MVNQESERIKINLQLFADDPPGAGNDPGTGGGNDDPPGGDDPKPQGGDGKTYDEEYVKTLRAEAAKYRTKAKELEGKINSMPQEVTAKVLKALGLEPDPEKNFDKQLEEAQNKAREAEQRANERLIRAEAKVQAAALGVKPERVDYALRLADLSSVEVGDDGEPDAAAIKAALEKVLNDLPELRGATAPAKSGSEFQGGGTVDRNPWSKEHFNLTEQGRLMRENPQLAARLMKEAKAKRS